MQLYIDSYGAYLGVKHGRFYVRTASRSTQLIAVRLVNAIFLTQSTSISTNAMLLAIAHDIPIILVDSINHPVGQVWSGQFGSICTIRKQQSLFCQQQAGLEWIRQCLCQKIANQLLLLEQLQAAVATSDFADERQKAIAIAQKMKQNIAEYSFDTPLLEHSSIIASFRGWEGIASRHYFRAISAALPADFAFPFRSRRPALDPFNALLNYLYGILYAMVELALMKAGIDPYMGIMHADEYNKPTMVYDFIEPYRYWADAVAVRLCQGNSLSIAFFEQDEAKGCLLGSAYRAIVVNSFMKFMHQLMSIDGLSRKRITHLELAALKMATMLKERNKTATQ
jgi:CRISPR-associated protein Cas1